MKSKYNIFTKEELVNFMEKNEKNFRFLISPYKTMLEVKMDDVMRKLDKNLAESKKLLSMLKEDNSYKTALKIKEGHEQWQKLDKEYDRLSELRFGKAGANE